MENCNNFNRIAPITKKGIYFYKLHLVLFFYTDMTFMSVEV